MIEDVEYIGYKGNENVIKDFFQQLFVCREKKITLLLREFCEYKGFAANEYMSCHFAKEFPDPRDEEYFGKDGVVFYLDYPAVPEDVVVVLTNKEFYQVVKENYDNYVIVHQEEKEQIVKLLNALKRNLEV